MPAALGVFIFTLHARCGAVYCNRSCLWVCGCVCLWVCYHDILEIACIDPHKTGFVGKGSDRLQLIKFWPSRARAREGDLWRGEIFLLRLNIVSAQCLRLLRALFRLGALALSVIATATWLAGSVAGCPSQPVLYQND